MRKQVGFTLMELLVVMGIFTLITGASFTMLSSGRIAISIDEAKTQASENARRAMERLTKELRLSSFPERMQIYESLDTAGYGYSGSVVYFQIPLGSYEQELASYLDSNYTLQWGDENTLNNWIYYYLDTNSGQLFRGRCAFAGGADAAIDSTAIIARNISELSFTRSGSGSYTIIYITLSAQGQDGSKTATHTLQSGAKLRN